MAGGLMSVAGMNANADTVTVQSGQTLSEIADQNHTTVDAIAQANRIQNKNVILTGQKLNVTPGTQTAQASTPKIYQIKSGDTLYGIAKEFGVSVSDLMQWNHLSSTMIYPNQTLVINGGSNLATSSNASATNVATVGNNVASTTQSASSQSQINAVKQIARPTSQKAVSQTTQNNVNVSNTQQAGQSNGGSNTSILNSADAQYISNHESGGNYNAQNGQYIGRWQLSRSYLGGDYSPAHQDQVFLQYCKNRYGGVSQAAEHERAFGWY